MSEKENINKIRCYFELNNDENTSHHTSWQTEQRTDGNIQALMFILNTKWVYN